MSNIIDTLNNINILYNRKELISQLINEINTKSSTKPPGLYNFGATCFHNSVAQLIYRMDSLRDFLIGGDVQNQYKENLSVYRLINLLKEMKNTSKEKLDKETLEQIGVHQLCSSVLSRYNNEQEDAAEFLDLLLDKLVSYVNDANKNNNIIKFFNIIKEIGKCPTNFMPKDYENVNGSYKFTENANIDEIKKKILDNSNLLNECLDDSKYSKSYEYINVFTIDAIDVTPQSSIENYIKLTYQLLQHVEFSDGYAFYQKYKIIPSKYFIVNITPKSNGIMRFHHNIKLTNENNQIEINGKKYKMIGVVLQSGTIVGGHYISFIEYNNKWYKYNDSIVTNIENITNELNGNDFVPYIILYEEIN